MKTGNILVIVSYSIVPITAFRFHKVNTAARIAAHNGNMGNVLLVGLTFSDFAAE